MNFTTASTRGHRADWTRTSLALALALALCGTGSLNASAADATGANAFATVAQATPLHGGDAVMGALPMSQPIHVEVALKLRNEAALDALVGSNTRLQMNHQPPKLLTSEQFLANHAPTQAQAQTVADYLKSKGYTNVTIAPNRMLVSADGTAQNARDAFMTSFAQVKTNDGRIAYANNDAVRIPAALGDKVLAVVGLQNVHIANASAQAAPADGQSTIVQAHDPFDFPLIYGPSLQTAPSVVVGIVSNGTVGNFGGLNQAISDLNTFAANHSVGVQTQIYNVGGTSSGNVPDLVSDITSQSILGMANGQVRQMIFYNVPDTTAASLTADLNTIVSQNQTKIIADPYGVCETAAVADGSAAAQDAILKVGVAQGQTFAVSTGSPDGADQCNNRTNTPRWPSSSPYVVAVGGTLLSASTSSWGWDQVYNASGGSPSTFEPIPIWQSSFGIAGSKRVGIDVALAAHPASGAKIIVNNAIQQLGSNTLAAALFAGAWAQVLQIRSTSAGFAAPVLYALPATDFHDITLGNNNGGRIGLGFTAGPGYDDASGRGSLILNNVLADTSGLGAAPFADFTAAASARTVTFTDKSTDGFWTIIAHAWNFGDGTTSTATNPTHTYATDGVFTVTEKVTDNSGASTTARKSVVDNATQLFQNPGFETGTAAPWTLTSAATLVNDASNAHSGSWYASVGGQPGRTGVLSQTVTLPYGLSTATLSFYLEVPPNSGGASDLQVFVYDLTPPQKTYVFATFNGKATAGYVLQSYDMTQFIGHKILVKFQGHNYAPATAVWNFDDVGMTLQ